jgi:hypothetical protein
MMRWKLTLAVALTALLALPGPAVAGNLCSGCKRKSESPDRPRSQASEGLGRRASEPALHRASSLEDLGSRLRSESAPQRGELLEGAATTAHAPALEPSKPQPGTSPRQASAAPLSTAEKALYATKDASRQPRLLAEQRTKLFAIAEALDGKEGHPIDRGERDQALQLRGGVQESNARYGHVDWQTCIYRPVLDANRARFHEMARNIAEFKPDAIIGLQRGGVFVAEVLGQTDASLQGKITNIDKLGDANDQHTANANQIADEIERRINEKQTKFVVVDISMSGSFQRNLNKKLKVLVSKYPEVNIQTHWLRETIGLAAGEITGGSATVQDIASGLSVHDYPLRFVLGDDAGQILEGGKHEALHIFDHEGVITNRVAPHGEETARDLLVSLLSGKRSIE